MKKNRFGVGGSIHEIVPASRQNIDQRTPSGVRPVSSPVIPVKSDVQGAMKNGGESKAMNRSVKRMAVGGVPGPMGPGGGRGRGGPGQGSKGPAPGGMRGPGRGDPGQGKGGAPGQGQGKGPVPGGFMGGGAGQGQGKGPAPGGKDMRYPMGAGMGGMPMGGDMGGMDERAFLARMNGGPMPRAPGMKKGGKVSASSYRDMTGGAAGGIGRLEKSSIAAKTKSQKLKKGGKVRGYANGGPMTLDEIYAWNEKNNPNFKRPPAEQEAREREELIAAQRSKAAYGKAPYESAELPAPKKASSGPKAIDPETGGTRMTPSQKRSAAAEMGVTLDENRYGDSERGNGPGSYASTPSSRTVRKTEADNSAIRSQSTKSIAKMIEVARNNGNQREVDRLTKLNPEAAAMVKPRAVAPSPAPVPRPRPKAADKPSSAEAVVGRGRSDQRASTDRENVRLGGAQSAAIDKMIDLARRNGNQKEIDRLTALKSAKGMKKGGKVEAFEGTRKDMSQDKKLAKKRGMSLKAWEKSSADEKHDKQQNMKGLKKGGAAKYAMGGKVSTSQTGMKTPLRPKPSAMAMGGKVKRMAGGGNSTEGFSYPYDDQAERQTGRENSSKSGTVRQFLDNLDRSVGLLPKYPNYKRDEMGNPFRDRQDPKKSVLGPSRQQSAMTMGENKSQGETGSKDYKNARRLGASPRGRKSGMSKVLVGSEMTDDIRNKERVNELGMKKGGKAEMHAKGCKCMACGGMAKMAKGGKVGMTFGKPLPGTKVSSQKIRSTVSTDGANMKKDGMKGQLRAKASGAKTTAMMKPLGMTKMAKGGKVRGAGIAQRGTKFIGEV